MFAAEIPKFVSDAFVYEEYWKFAPEIWNHAVVVQKRENLEEWNLLNSWVDLRGTKHQQETDKQRNEYGHQFGFGVIKHRVVRNPTSYMTYIIVPLFLMVASAFSIFFIDLDNESDEYQVTLQERLSVLVTLLLTVAAFQLQISENLPFKEQYTLIDHYFLMAYLVLFGLIWESAVAKAFEVAEVTRIWDAVFGVLVAAVWMIHSMQFFLKWITFDGFESGPSCCGWDSFLRMICCGMCGCWQSLKMCLFVSCGGCCRTSKRRERMKRWLRAEMNESASWDWGTNGTEKYAELVLGTDHTIRYDQYDEQQTDGRTGDFAQKMKAKEKLVLKLRKELVEELKRENPTSQH